MRDYEGTEANPSGRSNRRLLLNRRRAAVAATIVVLAGNIPAATTASAATAPSASPVGTVIVPASNPITSLQDLLSLSFVTPLLSNVLLVNLSNPTAATEALQEADLAGVLDGMTINLLGLNLTTAAQQIAADANIDTLSQLVTACPDTPTGTRSNTAVTPYLDCNDGNGTEDLGTPVTSSLTTALLAAVNAVVSTYLPNLTGTTPAVTFTNGTATVNFPASFASEARTLLTADAYRFDRALRFTAYSSSQITNLQIQIDGNCLTYALSIGGDTCADTAVN